MAFGAAALVAFVALLVAGSGLTFFHDEWQYIGGRSEWNFRTLFRPHNEHWSTVPVLIYKVLLETVGLRTYLPYQMVVVGLHLVTAGALFALLRREAGPIVALAGGMLFLFLGSGGENLVWPAEIGWNAATAAGGWALVLVLRGPTVARPVAASLLLVVAVASSGVGLFFLASAGVALLLTPERRRQMWIVAPALIAYLLWFLFIGRSGLQNLGLTPAAMRELPAYIVTGVSNAMGRLTGWGDEPGLVLAILLVVATLWRSLGPHPLLVGALVGLVGMFAQFLVTGIARVQWGAEQSQGARYVYTAAFFLLLAIGSWLGTLRLSRARPASVAVLAVLAGVALAANLLALYYTRVSFLEATDRTRAAITVMQRFGGSPAVPANRGLFPIPPPDALSRIFARYGSPVEDSLTPLASPSQPAMDAALRALAGPHVVIGTEELVGMGPLPRVVDSKDFAVSTAGFCVSAVATGPSPQLQLTLEQQQSIRLESPSGGSARLMLAVYAGFDETSAIPVEIQAGDPVFLAVPSLDTIAWQVRIDAPTGTTATVCGGPSAWSSSAA